MPKDFILRTGRQSARQKNFGGIRLQSFRQSSGGLQSKISGEVSYGGEPQKCFSATHTAHGDNHLKKVTVTMCENLYAVKSVIILL
jgi:hypothetical protein